MNDAQTPEQGMAGPIENIAVSQLDTYGYYASGVLYAASLSLLPALLSTDRNYGVAPPLNLSQGEIFWKSYMLLLIFSACYLYLAKIFRINSWNAYGLFVLAGVETYLVGWLLAEFASVYMNTAKFLFFGAAEVLLLAIQLLLGRLHAKYARPPPHDQV